MDNDPLNNVVPYSTVLRETPEEDRPRERLAQVGPEALKNSELIAVLFRNGTRNMGAVALAERLLGRFDNSLVRLARASIGEICQVKGVGPVKAVEIKAALELGKRLGKTEQAERPRIRNASDVFDLLRRDFLEYETEHFKALLMNIKNDVLKVVEVSHGGLDGTEAAPRDVFRHAVREGAAAIIVAHNHPSGDPEPSRADIALTRRLVEASHIMGVSLLDHVVFGRDRYVSLKERELM